MSDLTAGVDVELELTRFVRRVRARAIRNLHHIHPKLDYSGFTFLLSIADAPDGIRGSELAESLGVHKSTASRAAATLEKYGLVGRVADPDDGRAQLLVLEADARAAIEEYRRNAHDRFLEIMADWPAAEVTSFANSLVRLNERAEQLL